MSLLFIDTETNGLPDMNKRASDPSQPHIVQFAATVVNESGLVVDEHNILVKPEGWEISPEMSAIHGVTQEMALADGLPEVMVAKLALGLIKESSLLVAHNLQFDKFLVRILLQRAGLLTDDMDAWWKALPVFCTMRATTDICKIPSERGGWKWPKLIEAHQHAFGEGFDGQHDALADVKACLRIYHWLMDLKGATR